MKIEEGKYYRTRDGRKVGSMAYMPEGRHSEFPWVDPEGNAWKANGHFSLFDDGESVHDIIAEWTEDMKIEEGKYYRTRDGRKVGPVMSSQYGKAYATAPGYLDPAWYLPNVGTELEKIDDLIAEWADEPAAPKPSPFVMRRELVPGVYGRATICSVGAAGIDIHCSAVMTADELDEAAHLFAQLAEYLRDPKP